MREIKRYRLLGNHLTVFKIFTVLIILLLFGCNEEEKESTFKNRPNIIFILADDMGYSDVGAFGGEIPTPNIDKLANNGIRFTNFYNSSRCCPSRAALITGQYPHQVGMGCMVDWPPNAEVGAYQGYMDVNQVTIANALAKDGYKSYMVGKWHLGEEKAHWPLQYGFDKYFGLISGASSYFELIKNQKRVRKMAYDNELWEPPSDGFYMTNAFSGSAVSFINQHDAATPFFMYLAYTAPHWPLHALEEDITLFEERYQKGWDSLAVERLERMQKMGLINKDLNIPTKPESIPNWATLSAEEKNKQARTMAVYAAMIYRMDAGIGQVIQTLKDKGLYENTVIMFASDNGATDANMSHRGLNNPNVPIGAKGSYVAYREPWAWLSNIPYQKYKKSSYWGGMRTPFIISYPKMTQNQNALSTQAGHFVDVLPTALQFANINAPEGYQSEGIDLSEIVATADSVKVASRPLFMEHMGNKAVIFENWKLLKVTFETEWSLFNLEKDPLETTNLAAINTEKVEELEKLYLEWEQRTGSYTLPNEHLE